PNRPQVPPRNFSAPALPFLMSKVASAWSPRRQGPKRLDQVLIYPNGTIKRKRVENARTEAHWRPRGAGPGATRQGASIQASYRHPELLLARPLLSAHGPGAAAPIPGP